MPAEVFYISSQLDGVSVTQNKWKAPSLHRRKRENSLKWGCLCSALGTGTSGLGSIRPWGASWAGGPMGHCAAASPEQPPEQKGKNASFGTRTSHLVFVTSVAGTASLQPSQPQNLSAVVERSVSRARVRGENC